MHCVQLEESQNSQQSSHPSWTFAYSWESQIIIQPLESLSKKVIYGDLENQLLTRFDTFPIGEEGFFFIFLCLDLNGFLFGCSFTMCDESEYRVFSNSLHCCVDLNFYVNASLSKVFVKKS